MLQKIRTIRIIILLSSFIAVAPAFGTSEEFVELCSVSHLPRTTRNTIDALTKFVQGWEHGEISCTELVQKLQKHKSLHLPGQTFHYYHVTDLTPIGLLDWIEELDIPSQQPDTLEPLTNMTNLKKLDITGYNGDQYVVSSLSALTELSITLDSDAEPIDLVTPLANLKTLRLDLRSGKYNLNVLPQSIETLSLTGLGLKSLRGIETLYQLRDLEIQSVKMRSLRGIESLPQRRLERLVINSSEIGDFSALAHLENQTELTISNTDLSDISFISKMITLQRADLSFNKINNLHPIANVRWLEHLNLGSNQISTSTPLDNLTQLKTLFLNHNFLPFIKLGNWPRLEVLELTKNNLGHGPQLSMEPWQYQIKELGLSMNELRELDKDVAKIQSIRTLGIAENRLANVVAISKLANLETLNVADNKIVDLSPLTSLTKLKELTFYDNPLQTSGCPVQPTTICTHP